MPVGTTLINLRRERGKTLSDMEGLTKIMGRMLSALENERWDELPAPVYVKGYIQNYASALGVDPKPLLEEYAKDTAAPSHAERVPLRRIPERAVVPHRLDVHQIPKQAWVAVAIAVLVVALLVWGVSALMSRDDEPPPIPPETTGTPDATGTTSAGGVAAGARAVGEGAFVLAVEVTEGQSSWLQVTVDGLIAYEGTLPGGESKEWTVSSEASVRVGKPAAVTLTRDGLPVTIPPAEGIAEVALVAGDE